MAFAEWLDPELDASFRVLDWDQQFQNAEGETIRDASYTPALIESGTCDLYTSFMADREWRKKKLAMPAVWPGRYVIVINKEHQDAYVSLDDLAGKLGAIIENSTQHTALDQMNATSFAENPTQYRFVATYGEGVDAVEAGEVDYTVLGADSALWYARHYAENSVAVFPIGPERMNNWAMHKEHVALQQAVEEFIELQQTTEGSALDQLFIDYTGLTYARYLRLISQGIK
jgi:membrane-bound lytic murein transglycosylase MltF